jgi:hypothetical protein
MLRAFGPSPPCGDALVTAPLRRRFAPVLLRDENLTGRVAGPVVVFWRDENPIEGTHIDSAP